MVAAVHSHPDGSINAKHDIYSVSLRFIPTENNCPPLAYKTENLSRFDSVQCSPASLKFRSGVEYGIALQLPPMLVIKSGDVQLACHETRGGKDSVLWTDSMSLRKTDVAYYCTWRCRLPVSQNGQRTKMMISISMENLGVLTLPLLVKTYSCDDRKGSMRGYPLGKLHFSFEVPRGSPTFEDSEAILDGIKFESAPWRL